METGCIGSSLIALEHAIVKSLVNVSGDTFNVAAFSAPSDPRRRPRPNSPKSFILMFVIFTVFLSCIISYLNSNCHGRSSWSAFRRTRGLAKIPHLLISTVTYSKEHRGAPEEKLASYRAPAIYMLRSVFRISCLFLRPRPWQFEI